MNITRGLAAKDLEIADERILNERARNEGREVQTLAHRFRLLDSRNDVLDIILNAARLAIVHTGLASATTLLRNVADKSSGVLTSTFVRVQLLDGCGDGRHIEKGHSLGRVDQQIEVAALRVVAAEDGTENAQNQPAVRGNDPANFIAVCVKGKRGFHSETYSTNGVKSPEKPNALQRAWSFT